MLRAGIHPKIVQERLGHGSIAVTLDTYSHVVPGLHEAAAQRFERVFERQALRILTDADLSSESACRQNVGREDESEREPPGTRTQNRLIKSQLLFLLS